MRRAKSLRIGVHNADAVVWEPSAPPPPPPPPPLVVAVPATPHAARSFRSAFWYRVARAAAWSSHSRYFARASSRHISSCIVASDARAFSSAFDSFVAACVEGWAGGTCGLVQRFGGEARASGRPATATARRLGVPTNREGRRDARSRDPSVPSVASRPRFSSSLAHLRVLLLEYQRQPEHVVRLDVLAIDLERFHAVVAHALPSLQLPVTQRAVDVRRDPPRRGRHRERVRVDRRGVLPALVQPVALRLELLRLGARRRHPGRGGASGRARARSGSDRSRSDADEAHRDRDRDRSLTSMARRRQHASRVRARA
eukprot:30306-Pelagococcus_subviridis.AAC.3